MNEFESPDAGEWVTPVKSGYLLQCCDCGLVHRMDFRVIKSSKRRKGEHLKKGDHVSYIQGAAYQVQFRAFREDAP